MGDAAELEAVGALVGGVGATLAFGLAAWIYRQQARDAQRAQASQISAWIMSPIHYPVVLNGSPTPVYNVHCRFAKPDGSPPHLLEYTFSVLPPGATKEIGASRGVNAFGVVAEEITMEISFTDGAGRRWRRTHDGRLLAARRNT